MAANLHGGVIPCFALGLSLFAVALALLWVSMSRQAAVQELSRVKAELNAVRNSYENEVRWRTAASKVGGASWLRHTRDADLTGVTFDEVVRRVDAFVDHLNSRAC